MASGNWVLTTGGSWNSNANWSGASFPNATTETATFATDITADATVTMGQAISVGSMTFSDNGASGSAWVVAPGGAFALTLGTSTITTTTNATISAAIAGTAALTKAGNATLTLSGGSSNSGAWNVNAGTWVVTGVATSGAGTVTVASGATFTNEASASLSKLVVVNSGGTANLTGAHSNTLTVTGRANVAGSRTNTFTVNSGGQVVWSGSGTGTGFNGSGLNGIGILGGSYTLNLAATAAGLYLGNASGQYGTLWLKDTATFIHTGSSASTDSLWCGLSTSNALTAGGYFRQTGGTFQGNTITFGWSNHATADISSGTFTPGQVSIGIDTNTTNSRTKAVINFLGGTVTITGALKAHTAATNAGCYLALTIDGASTLVSAGSAPLNGATGGTFDSILNITGGATLSTSIVSFAKTSGVAYVNFNNGKLQATGAGALISGTVAKAYVYSGGATIDTQGNTVTLPAMLAPPGSGITNSTIPLSSGGSGYQTSPGVQISGGGGTGATARAVTDLDPASATFGQVTSIVVTNPGINYTSTPTFTLFNSAPTVAATINTGAVTLGANASSGGFTKLGSGVATFTADNTYGGTTTISAGTLNIGATATAAGTLGLNDTSPCVITTGVLAFNRNDARTYSSTLSGAGTINVTGGARATVSGTNTFTGASAAIAISTTGSILRLTNNDSIGQGTSFGITVATSTALELDGTSGNLTGLPAKALTLSGAGVSSTGALRNIAGNNTYSGAVTLAAATTIGSDSGTLSLTSASAITGNTFALSFVGAADVDVSQAINTTTGTVTKSTGAGAAILRGTSSYTGTTTATTGYLGYAGSIAASTNGNFGNSATSVAVAEGAGLRYYGSGSATFSRGISFTGATAAVTYKLESNGSGAVTHSVAPTFASTNVTKTVQLGGTGTAANAVSYLLANNGTGAVSLAKADAGKWQLSNTSNSYTGNTTVTGGTLVLSIATWASGAKVTGTGSVSVSAGAKIQTLAGSGGSAQLGRHTYPSLTFAANSRIRIGG
jgi:autotransporter-associated beta strand protein